MPKELVDYFKFGNGRNWQDPYLFKVQVLTAEQFAGKGNNVISNQRTSTVRIQQSKCFKHWVTRSNRTQALLAISP